MDFLPHQKKFKKKFALVALTAVLVFAGSLLQQQILKVKADVVVLLVSNTAQAFGKIFPGQVLSKTYTVQLDNSAASSTYQTLLQPIAGEENLCPFLHVSNLDTPVEADTLTSAHLTSGSDSLDSWQVQLDVPGIAGQVAPDGNGGIVVSNGGHSCRITITTDLALADSGGCQGLDCEAGAAAPAIVNGGTGGGGNTGGGSSNSLLGNTTGGGGGAIGGGGSGSGGSNSSSLPLDQGSVAGAFTFLPSNNTNSAPGEVLGVSELPRTGAFDFYLIVFVFLVSAAIIFVGRKKFLNKQNP